MLHKCNLLAIYNFVDLIMEADFDVEQTQHSRYMLDWYFELVSVV